MTLCINGSTAGPLLVKLGLADAGQVRKRIVEAYKTRFRKSTMEAFVELMTHRRFRTVNFATVRHHVPLIADMTKSQLMDAVERHKETTAAEDYMPPYLKNIIPYLKDDERNKITFRPKSSYYLVDSDDELEEGDGVTEIVDPEKHARQRRHARRSVYRNRRTSSTMKHVSQHKVMTASCLLLA